MQNILLLHGAIGAKDQLKALTDSLSDKFTVHSINFSGHGGETFPDEGFSIPLFAKEVLKYLSDNKIGKTNIFGYSMGGYVAMYLAKYHPILVGRIVTVATKFHWDETIAAKEVAMLDAGTIERKVPAFAKQLEHRHSPNDWKIVLSKTKEMLLELGNQNCLQLEDYKTISSECLLLLGDKDKMVSREETIAVGKALPAAKFKLLPDTPHPIEQVSTILLTNMISEFLFE